MGLPAQRIRGDYYLFVLTNARTHTHTHMYILQNYITNAPTCFGASARLLKS